MIASRLALLHNKTTQSLTPREEEILNCLGDEMSNRQIADYLTVSLNTVKWYVRQIYNKLGVDNRGDAVARARSLGLLPAEGQEDRAKHNLPAAATPFVGREQEMDDLAVLIADPQIRIITLVGPGGIGKTRLALEAAGCELRPQTIFPDGIFFVSLAPLESAAEIVSALATTLNIHFQGSGNETEQLLNYLRQKEMLLVMDNFEHILDGRTLLAEINERAAKITLLVTSRERLQLRGEQLFPLQGLEMADSEDSAADSPAARLFLHITRRTVPDFQLLEGDVAHLLHICRLVGGMPLGLELAASWAGLLPLSEIAAEIEQSLQLLTSEHHDLPRRHRSMQAALDVSWRRLTSEQKLAFQELTVFRGGFTRSAAAEVAGATLPLLVTLVNKSWISYDREKDRYNIHELLRQYGAVWLSADPAHKDAVRDRHSAYFCGYLQKREADWYGPRQKEAASGVRNEIENIQRAWRLAAGQSDTLLLAQGMHSLGRYYLWDGRLKDGQQACRLVGDGLSKSIAEQGIDARSLALWGLALAWESEFVRDMAQREVLLAQSQDLLDQAAQAGQDTRAEQAFFFLRKAYAAGNKDYDESIHAANRGLELFRELGVRWGEAELLGKLGTTFVFRGAYDRAIDHLQNSLEIRRQLDDTQGIAQTLISLAFCARDQGDFEEAEKLHRQSIHLFQQLENRDREKMALRLLAFFLSWAGKYQSAREAAWQAAEMDRDLGQDPNPVALVFSAMATIHLGRYTEAMVITTESLEKTSEAGLMSLLGHPLMLMGCMVFVEGDFAAARRYLLQSSDVFAGLEHIDQAISQAILSHVARAQGEKKEALEYLTGALRQGIESRFILPIIYCIPAAALLAADDGNHKRAVELYGLAQQFGHIRNSRWFEDVACRELESVRASLPPDVASAAEAKGREMDVWETAEALLCELDNP